MNKKPHHTLTESFWNGQNGKINKADNHFAVLSMNQKLGQNNLLVPKPLLPVFEKDVLMTSE